MKKITVSFMLFIALTLCACTGQQEIAEVHAPAETLTTPETPTRTEEPASETAAPKTSEEQSVPEQKTLTAGTVENGIYRSDSFGFCFSIDDSWTVLKREEIADSLGYASQYATAEMGEILESHMPYVDLWASGGLITVQIMIEKPPIVSTDGTELNTPAEYMDHNAELLPKTYEGMGVSVSGARRYEEELCGNEFEAFFFAAEASGMEMTQTMMTIEKDGYFLTIYITCIGEDETEAVLSRFSELPIE